MTAAAHPPRRNRRSCSSKPPMRPTQARHLLCSCSQDTPARLPSHCSVRQSHQARLRAAHACKIVQVLTKHRLHHIKLQLSFRRRARNAMQRIYGGCDVHHLQDLWQHAPPLQTHAQPRPLRKAAKRPVPETDGSTAALRQSADAGPSDRNGGFTGRHSVLVVVQDHILWRPQNLFCTNLCCKYVQVRWHQHQ
jgi:hypothetical protein